jgi:hypothetical protein
MARGRGVKVAALLAGALVLLGATGCGGSSRLSKSAYEKKVRADGRDIKSAFQVLSSNKLSSLDQMAHQIGKGQDELRKAADDLNGVKPPKDVESDNKKLVKGLRGLADDLEGLKKGAAEGNPKKVQQAAAKLQSSSALKEAQAATSDMKKKGYKIGELSS